MAPKLKLLKQNKNQCSIWPHAEDRTGPGPIEHAPCTPQLTSRISRTSQADSSASSFSCAVPSTRSVLNSPLWIRGIVGQDVGLGGTPLHHCPGRIVDSNPSHGRTTMHPISGSPLVHHFEFDAFGLNGPAEASVAAVDAQFELLLELCPGRGCVCAGMMSVKEGGPLG